MTNKLREIAESKGREFWISMCTFNDGYTEIYECRNGEFEPTPPAEKIHVIEKSAYDKLAAALKVACSVIDELKEKLRVAISLASHKFDCTVMTNGKHECNCGYNELKRAAEKMLGEL